jgi:hypothetical protein
MAKNSIFEIALQELARSGRPYSDPISFQKYISSNGLLTRATALSISVQTLEQLDPSLRKAGVMVFRLGTSSDGRTTQFGLACSPDKIEDYFLIDREIFPKTASTFIPDASAYELFPFRLLGNLIEAGAINLAIASGLLGHALELDPPFPRVAPATGCSTYSFDVAPHARYDVRWSHKDGQVEIDAVLLAKRRGRWCLFVVEAKHGPMASLAKMKLAYPAAAVATKRLPPDVPIIPVYLRSWQEEGDHLRYAIAECDCPDPRRAGSAVASLAVVKSGLWNLIL